MLGEVFLYEEQEAEQQRMCSRRLGLTRWGWTSRHNTRESMQAKLKWLQVDANTAEQRCGPHHRLPPAGEACWT